MRMLIKNGRVIDPASNTDDIRDILVEDGVIAEVAKDIDKAADTVIDAKGCMVMPGLVDLHVHFREPGFEHKETIRTGARAAARGERKDTDGIKAEGVYGNGNGNFFSIR